MVETRNEIERQIERHIEQTRNELSENVHELEGRVKNVLNWRAQVEDRPVTMLAVAFGAGVLLSAMLPSARRGRGRSSVGEWTAPANGNGSSLPWNALKGALIGIATAKLSSFIEDILPGFEREFAKAKSASSRQELAPYGSD